MFANLAVFGAIAVAIYLVYFIWRNEQAYKLFRKRASAIPMAPGRNFFWGHLNEFVHVRENCMVLDTNHRLLGKTFGRMQLDKPFVATVDLDLIKKIVLEEGNEHSGRMPIGIGIIERGNIFFASGAQWRRLRRAVAPAFTNMKVKGDFVQERIHTVIEKLVNAIELRLKTAKPKETSAINFDDLIKRYMFELLLTCIYGQPGQIDWKSERDPLVDLYDRAEPYAVKPMATLTFALHDILDPLINRYVDFGLYVEPLMKIRAKIDNALKTQHDATLQSDGRDNKSATSERKDERGMIGYFIDRYREGNMSHDELMQSGALIFMAAFKTSADGATMLLYQLARQPHVQEKLRASLLQEGVKSQYLTWCINESLRLYPSLPQGCARVLGQDVQDSKGANLPKGTTVVPSAYTIHRMPEYWGDDADEYKPERWAKADTFHPLQYMPFGAGKRRCPGEFFALNEIKSLTNTLLRKYKFELAPEIKESGIKFTAPLFITLVTHNPAIRLLVTPLGEVHEASNLSSIRQLSAVH